MTYSNRQIIHEDNQVISNFPPSELFKNISLPKEIRTILLFCFQTPFFFQSFLFCESILIYCSNYSGSFLSSLSLSLFSNYGLLQSYSQEQSMIICLYSVLQNACPSVHYYWGMASVHMCVALKL